MAPDNDTTDDGMSASRRTFLATVGAASVGIGAAGAGLAQAQTFEFGGEVGGWMGRAPDAISGETNPTLELEAGTQYEFVWENVDGAPHNVVIEDDGGNALVSTEIMDQQGATQSVVFTATEEMASYFCEVHPTSMRGDVTVSGGSGTATGTETGTPAAQERFFPEGPSVGVERVASGPLVNPTGLHSVPGEEDTRLVVDQMGQIYVHTEDGLDEDPFLDISDQLEVLTDAEGGFDRPEGFDERGLLGLAFHPEFEDNGQFYVRYSAPETAADDELVGPPGREMPEDWDHVEVLAEYTAADDLSEAESDSERVLLEVPEPQFNHNSGDLAFGPDGYLYVGLGDGGGADDTGVGHVDDWYDDNEGGNGQDVEENLLGSILRLDVDEEEDDRPYGVPDDNPLDEGYAEQYAWGLRNPWRFSFADGMLIVADVGQNLYEEVNVVERGGNYGWNVKEGAHCFSTENPNDPPSQCPTETDDGEPLVDPVIEYPHQHGGQTVGISVTGGYVYEGDGLAEIDGDYVFGDWSASFAEPRGRLFVASPPGEGTVSDLAGETGTATPTGTSTATETADGTGTPTGTATEMGGTATGTETATATGSAGASGDGMWEVEELVVEGGEDGGINRFISSFARDADGELYVLVSETGRLTDEVGEVYRLVPAGEGESVSAPATPTATATPEGGGEGETATPTGTSTDTPTETDTPTDG